MRCHESCKRKSLRNTVLVNPSVFQLSAAVQTQEYGCGLFLLIKQVQLKQVNVRVLVPLSQLSLFADGLLQDPVVSLQQRVVLHLQLLQLRGAGLEALLRLLQPAAQLLHHGLHVLSDTTQTHPH